MFKKTLRLLSTDLRVSLNCQSYRVRMPPCGISVSAVSGPPAAVDSTALWTRPCELADKRRVWCVALALSNPEGQQPLISVDSGLNSPTAPETNPN